MGVKPRYEPVERVYVLSREVDDTVNCFCDVAIQRSLKIFRAFTQASLVERERLLARTAANLDFHSAVKQATASSVSMQHGTADLCWSRHTWLVLG